MTNSKEIIKYCRVLNIISADEIYADCINHLHKKQYLKVLNSSLNKKDKNNLLIEINNAKEILEKINTEDLKKFFVENKKNINADKLTINNYKIKPTDKEEFKNKSNTNSKNEYIKKPKKIISKRKYNNKPIFISLLELCFSIFYYVIAFRWFYFLFIYFLDEFTTLEFFYDYDEVWTFYKIDIYFMISLIIFFLVKKILRYD